MSDLPYIQRASLPLKVYAWTFLVVLYIPVLFLPLFSFNQGLYARFPIESFTTRWYVELMDRDPLWNALYNSLKVGGCVAVIATFLGVFAARAITRFRIPGRTPITGFLMLPLVIPGIIFGVALLVLMSRLGIPLSLWTVGLGHLIVCLPFSVATLLPRFEGLDRSMEEASADLGDTPAWTFWRVTLPMVFPGIVASLLLTFTISFDEFIMAFFLSSTEPTLPMYIWSQLRFPQEFPSVLAMSSIILLVSFIVVFIALWIGRMGADRSKTRVGL